MIKIVKTLFVVALGLSFSDASTQTGVESQGKKDSTPFFVKENGFIKALFMLDENAEIDLTKPLLADEKELKKVELFAEGDGSKIVLTDTEDKQSIYLGTYKMDAKPLRINFTCKEGYTRPYSKDQLGVITIYFLPEKK